MDAGGDSDTSDDADDVDEGAGEDCYHYDGWTLMQLLMIADLLKPGVSFKKLFQLTLEYFMQQGRPLGEIHASLLDGTFHLPHRTTIRRTEQRLDAINMHWRRLEAQRGFLGIGAMTTDASPQNHHNYLCGRQDQLVFAASAEPAKVVGQDYLDDPRPL